MQFADTSALLLMTSQIDITIQRSTLSKIDSWGTEAILVVKTPGSITADGLVIQDCNASEYLVSLNATAYPKDPFSGNVTVQNSLFVGPQPSLLISSSSTLISNSALLGANVPFGSAAVVNVTSNSSTEVVASNFTNLSTSAAEYPVISLTANTSTGIIRILRSRFVGNLGLDGSIKVQGHASVISGSYFEANIANNGGAAYIDTWDAEISDCQFFNNTAWRGGALYMNSKSGNITDCLFDSNSAKTEDDFHGGGAVLLTSNHRVSLVGFELEIESSYIISSSRFISNYAISGGGGIGAHSIASLIVDNCVFEQSQLEGVWGAAIIADSVTNVLLGNSLITTSSSVAVDFRRCLCVGVMNSNFTNSTATSLFIYDHEGRALCEDHDPFGNNMFNRSWIANTEADTAHITELLSEGLQVSVAIWNCQFTHHRVSTSALPRNVATAALSIDAGSTAYVLLAGVLFDQNVGTFGSAFTHSASFKTIVWGCTFSNNHATRFGAALLALRNKPDGRFLLGDTIMVNNTALRGAAMYGDPNMEFQIVNSHFLDNIAVSHGGAIYCGTCRVLMLSKSVVKGNSAGQDGGGIYCDTCVQVLLEDTQLLSNRCAYACGLCQFTS